MSVDLSLLETLKKMLLTSDKFLDVQDYFLRHFGENLDFMALGSRVEDQFLATVLEQVGRQILKKAVKMGPLVLVRLPEQGFVHGSCFINGIVASVFFFEDAQMGLVCLAPPDGMNQLARFSGRSVPRAGKPSVN